MADFSSAIWNKPAAAAAADDVVTKSLRFDGGSTSDYLARDIVSGSTTRTKWVYSAWRKRAKDDAVDLMLVGAENYPSADLGISAIRINGNGEFEVSRYSGDGYTFLRRTEAAYRDVSAWYHFVAVYDGTAGSAAARLKLYVNGGEVTSFKSGGDYVDASSIEFTFGESGYAYRINSSPLNPSGITTQYGYYADVYWLDGTVTLPSGFTKWCDVFAEEDGTTGQWKPKATTGLTFGTNGFRLDYADSTVSSTSFIDSSSNGLTVTANGGVAHSETQKKIGDSSIAFDGTGDYLSLNGESGLAFDDGDYTIEMWFNPTSTSSTVCLYDGRSTGGYYDATPHIFMTSGGGIDIGYSDGSANHTITASGVFPTTGTWYHVALVRTSGTTRAYIDGSEVGTGLTDAATLTNPSGRPHIGQGGAAGGYDLSGYIDEIRVSSMARYSGTGSDAFTPPTIAFEDDVSDTKLLIHSSFSGGIGNDAAGSNNFTATNLAASDVVEDTPTDNYCVLNPLANLGGSTLSEGNLKVVSVASTGNRVWGSIPVSSGKWYFEAKKNTTESTSNYQHWGVYDANTSLQNSASTLASFGTAEEWEWVLADDGDVANNGQGSASGLGGVSQNDIVRIAIDMDTSKFWVGLNDAWDGDPAAGTGEAYANLPATVIPFWHGYAASHGSEFNFGQSDFAHTPPENFKALSTANLPPPTIAKPAEHFNTVLYTGNNSTNPVTGVGFRPDLLWVKARSDTRSHNLVDSVRDFNGTSGRYLMSNDYEVESESAYINSLDSDGFTVSGSEAYINSSSNTYVAWNWLAGTSFEAEAGESTSGSKNVDAGFSIATWTGDDDSFLGSAQTITHGLNPLTPEMIIAKGRTDNNATGSDWIVYHKDLSSGEYLILNDTGGTITPMSAVIDNIGDTTVDFGSDGSSYYFNTGDYGLGIDADTYISYFFASVEGYSKVGSISSSSSSAFCFLGFRPSFILAKRSDSTGSWLMFDDKREGYNVDNDDLEANSSAIEATTDHIDILSNGFKIRTSDSDLNAGTVIYYAVGQSSKYANAR